MFIALTAPTTAIPDISKNPSSLEHHVYAKGYELHYRPLKHPDSFGVTKELIKNRVKGEMTSGMKSS